MVRQKSYGEAFAIIFPFLLMGADRKIARLVPMDE